MATEPREDSTFVVDAFDDVVVFDVGPERVNLTADEAEQHARQIFDACRKARAYTAEQRRYHGKTLHLSVLSMATVAEVRTFAERFQAENSTMLGRGGVPIWRDAVSRAIGRAFRDPRHVEVVRDPVEIEGILNYLDRVQHVINAAWADGTPAP